LCHSRSGDCDITHTLLRGPEPQAHDGGGLFCTHTDLFGVFKSSVSLHTNPLG
jgi:hypothetical protein